MRTAAGASGRRERAQIAQLKPHHVNQSRRHRTNNNTRQRDGTAGVRGNTECAGYCEDDACGDDAA